MLWHKHVLKQTVYVTTNASQCELRTQLERNTRATTDRVVTRKSMHIICIHFRLATYHICLWNLNALFVLVAFRRAESDAGFRNSIFEEKKRMRRSVEVFKIVRQYFGDIFFLSHFFPFFPSLSHFWCLCVTWNKMYITFTDKIFTFNSLEAFEQWKCLYYCNTSISSAQRSLGSKM